jgi:hypothetical protein
MTNSNVVGAASFTVSSERLHPVRMHFRRNAVDFSVLGIFDEEVPVGFQHALEVIDLRLETIRKAKRETRLAGAPRPDCR